MLEVTTKIEILCPKDKVSQFAADPDNAPEWYKNIKAVAWQTPRPLKVGSKVAFEAQFLGRKLSYTYEVMELSGEKMVMRTAEGPFPMETSYEWHATGPDTTLMLLRNRGNPTGFSRFFSPFIANFMRKANQNDLKLLKQILEKD
jgi:hypothetical protein